MVSGRDDAIRYPDARGRRLGELIASCPPGAVVHIAPGRYHEPVIIDRPITLRGAGDLTRLVGFGRGSVVRVDVGPEEEVRLEGLSLEAGDADEGGALLVRRGRVVASHLRMSRSRARVGGAVAATGGVLIVERVRIEHAEAERGGAVWVGSGASVELLEAQISGSRARYGGALAVESGGRLWLESVTVRRSRALERNGGQVLFVAGGGVPAEVALDRVRFADPPLGRPLVLEGSGAVAVSGCDLPRSTAAEPGVLDRGDNRWR